MSRIVPAVAAGLLAGQLVALLLWWWGFYISPPSPLVDLNPMLARADPGRLPFTPLFWQALGQGLGALLGGLWAMRTSREGPKAAWVVGGLSFLAAIVWMLLRPRPFWFVLLSALFVGAAAWGAGRLGAPAPRKRRSPRAASRSAGFQPATRAGRPRSE